MATLFSSAQSVGWRKESKREHQLFLVKELVSRDVKIIPSPCTREAAAVLLERPN